MPSVDVDWDGVPLAKGATAREQDGGWFVELEQPMPVGTSLTLSGEVQKSVTVTRVHEGIGAGMLVKTAISHQPSAISSDESEKGEGGGEKADGGEKTDGGEKKEKRRRKR